MVFSTQIRNADKESLARLLNASSPLPWGRGSKVKDLIQRAFFARDSRFCFCSEHLPKVLQGTVSFERNAVNPETKFDGTKLSVVNRPLRTATGSRQDVQSDSHHLLKSLVCPELMHE
jgi:hypothetical protein